MTDYFGKSDIGRSQGNEDRFVADAGWGIGIVADGMGGADAGEVAAAIATNTIIDDIDRGAVLQDAIAAANAAILQAVSDGRGKPGMGTTVVAVHFEDHEFEIAWVGDSRAYLWNGELLQLTRDHSKVERLLAAGEIQPYEAGNHPQRNQIYRALGQGELVPGDVSRLHNTLCQNEMLLLCSDGLNDAISGTKIAEILNQYRDEPRQIPDQLINAALNAGGKDNITVVLVVADHSHPKRSEPLTNPVSVARLDGSTQYFKA
jgi:PPM family protein phosphatase